MINERKKLLLDLKKTLAEIRKLEPKEGRPRAERRRAAREKLLPKDRVCPICEKVKHKSRSWVITHDGPICRSCHWKGLHGTSLGTPD